MNAKVNNWAVELKSYNLKFEYIQGIKNTLADTLSRLIKINPDVALPAEQQEVGYNFFEDLPSVEVGEIIIEGLDIKLNPDTFSRKLTLNLPLKPISIRSLQAKNAKINNILQRFQVGDLDANVYMVEDGIQRKRIVEPTGNEHQPIEHDYSRHNGFPRRYAAIRHLYFWVDVKKDVKRHCRKCQLCTNIT